MAAMRVFDACLAAPPVSALTQGRLFHDPEFLARTAAAVRGGAVPALAELQLVIAAAYEELEVPGGEGEARQDAEALHAKWVAWKASRSTRKWLGWGKRRAGAAASVPGDETQPVPMEVLDEIALLEAELAEMAAPPELSASQEIAMLEAELDGLDARAPTLVMGPMESVDSGEGGRQPCEHELEENVARQTQDDPRNEDHCSEAGSYHTVLPEDDSEYEGPREPEEDRRSLRELDDGPEGGPREPDEGYSPRELDDNEGGQHEPDEKGGPREPEESEGGPREPEDHQHHEAGSSEDHHHDGGPREPDEEGGQGEPEKEGGPRELDEEGGPREPAEEGGPREPVGPPPEAPRDASCAEPLNRGAEGYRQFLKDCKASAPVALLSKKLQHDAARALYHEQKGSAATTLTAVNDLLGRLKRPPLPRVVGKTAHSLLVELSDAQVPAQQGGCSKCRYSRKGCAACRGDAARPREA